MSSKSAWSQWLTYEILAVVDDSSLQHRLASCKSKLQVWQQAALLADQVTSDVREKLDETGMFVVGKRGIMVGLSTGLGVPSGAAACKSVEE